jgi:aspartyl-tRNA(Asn)/glutamyl-tRNA(Gln) amidotransferase subunit B
MRPVIGLEIHAQLDTRTKLFCSCSSGYFQAPPNTHTCPVCLGMPGALPVLNERAVEYALRAASALRCEIPGRSKFDRKNYFYPDLPKGYQISQYDEPIARNGHFELAQADGKTKTIRIRRVHLEEDAGKLIHDETTGRSLVDLNRAGVPLIEIVTEPDLASPEEAARFMRQLRQLLRYLDICGGDMEKGELRCDANISLTTNGKLGTKTEIKNMNSFHAVEAALDAEAERQRQLLASGGRVTQATLGWNPDAGNVEPQRVKEEADDYRYFPEPDLVPLAIDAVWIERIRKAMPELPAERRARWGREYQLPNYDIQLLTEERELADYFEAVVRLFPQPKDVSNWMMSELLRLLKEMSQATDLGSVLKTISPAHFAQVLQMVAVGQLNRNTGKEVIEEAFKTGRPPQEIVDERGLAQISDTETLARLAAEVIEENPGAARDYRAGNAKVIGFLLGKLMAKTSGKANPKTAGEVLRTALK